MNAFRDGWFTETGVLNSDGVSLSVKADSILHREKSKYQDILVFQSSIFGRCLVLDDAIQCTEMDEFSYQEMIAFLPLNCHANPRKVLIIGGGDGGVAREVVKHPLVERVVQCEIDEAVIRVSKMYLPFMSSAFDDPKLDLHIEDGLKFVENHKSEFDVIITDSCDPKGAAVELFERPYYQALFESLRPGGIVCSQAESYWFDLKLIKSMLAMSRTIFTSVAYASTSVPSYPSGQIGFLLCSKNAVIDFAQPVHTFTDQQRQDMNLRYYSEQVHRNSLSLPPFVQQELVG